jgi:TPR repeat protein
MPTQIDARAAALFVSPDRTLEANPAMHSIREALWDQESEPKALPSELSVHNLYLALMALVVAVAALASGYLLAPAIQRQWFRSSIQPATASTVAAAEPLTNPGRPTVASSSEDLRNLAEAGDVDAQYFLAVRYHTGANVLQDDTQAVKWFERAANQGHVLAQATLPSYYGSGVGVPKDLSKAYFWAALAWAQGDEKSKTTLDGLSTQMSPSQVDAARRQAENWLRQHNHLPKPVKRSSPTPSSVTPGTVTGGVAVR